VVRSPLRGGASAACRFSMASGSPAPNGAGRMTARLPGVVEPAQVARFFPSGVDGVPPVYGRDVPVAVQPRSARAAASGAEELVELLASVFDFLSDLTTGQVRLRLAFAALRDTPRVVTGIGQGMPGVVELFAHSGYGRFAFGGGVVARFPERCGAPRTDGL